MFHRKKKQLQHKREIERKKRKAEVVDTKKQNDKENKSDKSKRRDPFALTVFLDKNTGTVNIATNFKSLPMARGMLEEACDNIRQINTIRLDQLDREYALKHQTQEKKAKAKADKFSQNEKNKIHKKMNHA